MDAFERDRSSNSKTSSNSSAFRRRRDSWKKAIESDENSFSFLRNGAQSLKKENDRVAFKKKVLTERIMGSSLQTTAQTSCQDPVLPISTQFYDPISNFTSPRPRFLRYNPNNRRELLKRIEGEKMNDEGDSMEDRNGSDSEDDDEDMLEVEKNRWNSRFECKLFLICAVVLLIFYFSTPVPVSHVSFEANESSTANVQKTEERGLLELTGNGLFPEIMLGSYMGLSQMSHHEVNSSVQRSNSYDETLQNGGLFWNACVFNETVIGDGNEGQRDYLFTIEVETLKLENVVCSTDVCSDTYHSEDLNLNDSLWTSQHKLDQGSQLGDHWPEKAGLSMSSPLESKDSDSYIVLRGTLGLLPMLACSISVVICLFTGFLKYFQRPSPGVSLNSIFLLFKRCMKAETGENIVTNAQMKDKISNKLSDDTEGSQANGVRSVEFKETSGFRLPRVELLGEFSTRDGEALKNGFGLNSKLKGQSDSQLSSNQKRSTGKKLSLSFDTVDSHSAEKSASKRCSSKEGLTK
ncbi:hypothetical protein HPP92_024050 [Vanilla planifolia]|uniref:Uncharacterized protein n=1 Tax=Vanilla planifolia TaxID=51239 RepID=A0A835UC77_VANPL|nr:hypothetical protein HPP92_024050 [Vanilla planifolia]